MFFHPSSHDPDCPGREDSRPADDLVGHQALHFRRLELLLGFLD
jgi:hypothetical protein